MGNPFRIFRSARIEPAAHALTNAATVEEIVAILRNCARSIAGADGITVVRRFGNEVAYVDEDAISPLWTGQRFPISICVSGMAMLAKKPIYIPDIRADLRVPLNLYLSTFVRSMAMFPIGGDEPEMAMGVYWREARTIEPEVIERMTGLSRLAGDALADITARGAQRYVA